MYFVPSSVFCFGLWYIVISVLKAGLVYFSAGYFFAYFKDCYRQIIAAMLSQSY